MGSRQWRFRPAIVAARATGLHGRAPRVAAIFAALMVVFAFASGSASASGTSAKEAAAKSANSTHWAQISTPDVQGPLAAGMNGVACSTSTFCAGVGSQQVGGGDTATLAEQWNGSAWKVLASPNGGFANSQLNAVNCTAQTSCVAVGVTRSQADKPLAELWNGKKWALMNTQSLPHDNSLDAVNCIGVDFCMAVGRGLDDPLGTTYTTAASWNGTAWTNIAVPTLGSSDDMTLGSLSCVSASLCVAVGDYDDGDYPTQTLIESWNGQAWSIVTSPNSTSDDSLGGVKCVSATNCVAVGSGTTGTSTQTLVETWSGSAWTVDGAASEPGELQTLSCSTNVFCLAIGSVTEIWNGALWSKVSSPSNAASLVGIKCTAPNFCMSVGTISSSTPANTTAADWNGKAWTVLAMPSIAGSLNVQLNAVSCIGTTFCMVVGSVDVYGPDSVTLFEEWNGASWQRLSAPAGATYYLDSVKCTAVSFCIAVGYSNFNNVAATGPLVELWNGSKWSVVPSPGVPNMASAFADVTCSSATMCFAVGNSSDQTNNSYQTLIEKWDGHSMTIISSPNVSGAQTNVLSGVACGSATFCFAVGDAYTSFPPQSLTEEWRGGAWSIIPSPNPSNGASLASVACPNSAFCIAGGYTGGSQPWGEVWNGSAWATVASPGLSANSVRCIGTAFCMEVGDYSAAAWSGSAWSSVALPSLTYYGTLSGLGCTSKTFCMSVGYETSKDGTLHGLAERWS